MKTNGKKSMFASVGVIIFVAYNVLFFVIGGLGDQSGNYWMSYIFMLIAFATIATTLTLLGDKGMLMRDWLFGYPIVKHCTIYFVSEIILSTLFSIIGDSIDWKLPFITQFLVLVIFLVFAISCFLAKKTIEEIKGNVDAKTSYFKFLRTNAEMVCEKCADIETKKAFIKLAEEIRFSDPMSHEALAEIEKELFALVAECDKAVVVKDYETALLLCNKASLLLVERNKKCMVLK